MKISPLQIIFLERHKVPLWYILDASGMSPKEYKSILNDTDLLVALNSGSKKCNHHNLHIRDRHGQCVECRVSKYSFIIPKKDGYVYVLGSIKGRILKVGYTYDLKDRHIKINHDGYGGYNDWEIIYSGKYKEPLNIEFKLHSKLKGYGIEKIYSHYGKMVSCYELYECSYDIVSNEIKKINNEIGELFLGEKFEMGNCIDKYDFGILGIVAQEKNQNYKNDYKYYLEKYGIIL